MLLLRALTNRLIGLSALIGGVCLVGLMGVIVADVIGRSLGMPLFGGQDLIVMGMVLLVFGGMASCATSGGHIAVDLLQDRFPRPMNRAIDIFVTVLGVVIFGLIAWTVHESARLSQMLNISTNLLNLPRAWFQWGLSAMSAICALGLGVRAVDLILPGKDMCKDVS